MDACPAQREAPSGFDAPRVKRLRSESSSRSSVSSGSSHTKPGSVRLGEESPRMEPVPSRFLWDVSQGDSIVMGVTATPKLRPTAANEITTMSPRSASKETPSSSSLRKVSFSMPPMELSPTDLVAEADEYEVVSRQGSEEWTTTKLRGVRSGKELTLEHVGFTLVEVSVDDGETFTSKHNKLQVFASEDSMAAARLNR